MYDASNTKHIRKQLKALKAQEAQDAGVLQSIMASPAGRSWMHSLLADCHVFASSFNLNAGQMSFNEGERNVGLKLFSAVVRHCPEPYIQMMREAEDGRRITDDSNRRSGPDEDERRDTGGPEQSDLFGGVESEYEPALED